jgi:hypothetical protein
MLSNSEACQNLGVKEISKRKLLGAGGFFLGIILAVMLIASGASNPVRLVVFVPFFVGYLGLFQAHHKTCVLLGLRGQQNMDQGNQVVADLTQRAKLRSRAIKILFSSALLSALCTFKTVEIHFEGVAVPF